MKSAKTGTDLKARDVMTRHVLSARPEWPIEQLSDFLVKNSISGAPVTSEDGELIGVVSLTDIARSATLSEEDLEPIAHDYYFQMLDGYDGDEEQPLPASSPENQVAVSEIMTPIVIDVGAGESVRRVAEIMIENKIHRLFVTDGGKIEGVITTLDMLKAIRDS